MITPVVVSLTAANCAAVLVTMIGGNSAKASGRVTARPASLTPSVNEPTSAPGRSCAERGAEHADAVGMDGGEGGAADERGQVIGLPREADDSHDRHVLVATEPFEGRAGVEVGELVGGQQVEGE